MATKLRLSKLQREFLAAMASGATLNYDIHRGYSLRIPGQPHPKGLLTNTVSACFQRNLIARSNGDYVVSPEALAALGRVLQLFSHMSATSRGGTMEHCPFCDNNDTCPGNDVADEIVRLRSALESINAIRDRVIRTQRAMWASVVYPLVAVLNEAGFASTHDPHGRLVGLDVVADDD